MACSMKDAAALDRLYRKYVTSRGDVDTARLVKAVRRETHAAERGTVKVSPGLLRELRADRAVVGGIARRCR
jgi:hypothetical protein